MNGERKSLHFLLVSSGNTHWAYQFEDTRIKNTIKIKRQGKCDIEKK
jgi:hypothetical protein